MGTVNTPRLNRQFVRYSNRYNIRLAWKMSQAKLLPKKFGGKVRGTARREPRPAGRMAFSLALNDWFSRTHEWKQGSESNG